MAVLGCVGDLVEDVVIRLCGSVNLASDTDAVVSRRRGGSAANVAEAAARIVGEARFIGSVGDDRLGDALLQQLADAGVEFVGCRGGRTGSIVVLVDDQGERTMLSDRGSSIELVDPQQAWLVGLEALHVPFYSLAREPLASTCRTLVGWARSRDIAMVSLDVSSTAVVAAYGIGRFHDLLIDLGPDLVFANEAEAGLIGIEATVAALASGDGQLVVHGPGRATVYRQSGSVDVPAVDLGPIGDTTGAGDAFAAGYLIARLDGVAPAAAARSGHDAACGHLTNRSRR